MMKILITGDWHADAKTLGHSRFSDVDRAVREMVDYAVDPANGVDVFCFLGDLCDPDAGSASFRSVELVVRAAVTLSRANVVNVWVAGNHDVIEDGSGDTTLSPLRPLTAQFGGGIQLFERPGTWVRGGVAFHALPFAATSHAYHPADLMTSAQRGGSARAHVVLAHLAVAGVQPGEETTDMPRGREVLFPRELFPETAEDVHLFNGHYHRQQTHELVGHRPVHIPGAPARFTFGEQSHEPGYLLMEV